MQEVEAENWPVDWPVVAVHGFHQACAVLRYGRPVALLSGAGAGIYGGAGWWRAMIGHAALAMPDTPMRDILDCGAAPGAAMAALRMGQRCLVLAGSVPAWPAVASAAATLGCVVLPARPPALDLDHVDAPWRLAALLAMPPQA